MSIFMIIAVVITAAAYLWFDNRNTKKAKSSQIDQEETQKTAQDFINVRDVGKQVLYTLDNKIFAFVKIEGLCLELYSRAELHSLSNKCSAALSKFRRPYKYIAVSRRVDLSKTLMKLQELYRTAYGGQRALLRQEIEDIANLEMSGDTLERQHYIAVWSENSAEREQDVVAAAEELAKIFSDNGIMSEVINDKGIIKFLGLVNVPDYAHIDSPDIEATITALTKSY